MGVKRGNCGQAADGSALTAPHCDLRCSRLSRRGITIIELGEREFAINRDERVMKGDD